MEGLFSFFGERTFVALPFGAQAQSAMDKKHVAA
jgi:hypothetical protein